MIHAPIWRMKKAAAKADAQAKADEAKKNIDAATTNAEVDQAKSTGTTEVNAVNPQAVAKPAASKQSMMRWN